MNNKELLRIGITGRLMEDDQQRIHVVGKHKGEDVSIGWITKELMYQDPDLAHKALSKIRFCQRMR
ncbi:MAG: hypothetical protein KAJ93_06090 [Methanosarcinales archaeon]|nr:hypothetical protein [Methanosarcinales archaeon]